MDRIYSLNINILFLDPFWICILEEYDGRNYSACKVTFGAEPKDYEVYGYLLKYFYKLKFSPKLEDRVLSKKNVNPKRAQREIKKSAKKSTVIGTKAQRALNLMHDENKLNRKKNSKEREKQEFLRKFHLKMEKKKQKHKGR